MRRLTVLVVLTLALSGCGGSDDETAIRATLTAETKAVNAQQFERACALHTKAAQPAWPCLVPADEDENDGYAVTYGGEAIVTYEFRSNEIEAIDVDGDTAGVRYTDDQTTRMRKVDGRWLIDSA